MVDVERAFRRGKKYEWVLTKPSALLQAKTVQWTAAKINLNIFSLRDVGEGSEEEIAFANIKLFSKNHWFLWIEDNGDVSGTQGEGYEVTLQLQSFGNGLVRIYSPKMGRFIAMDSNGRLFSTKNKTDSTIFKHVKEMNGFHTFSSHKYYRETPHDMYIALQKDGIPRKGNKTCRLHKGSQFLII